MRIDLETVPTGSSFQSEICIVGGGVAGQILARQLATAGREVHLLEGGGETFEERSQQLYDSEMRGKRHDGTTIGRFRTFGGSSTRWAGQLLPYPDEVFEKRDAVGGLGWPISARDLAPYQEAIIRFMGVDDLSFHDDFFDQVHGPKPPSTPEVLVRVSKWSPLSRRDLGRTLGRENLASPRTTVFFHANVVSIDLHPAGDRVESITVRNYQGGQFTFKARTFVLCCGTVEASRLLLASDNVHPAGIGNAHDLVGRYFHDHVTIGAAWVRGPSLPHFHRYFAPHFVRNTLHTPRLESPYPLQKKLGLLMAMAAFYIEEPETSGYTLLRAALKDVRRGKLPSELLKHPGRVPAALGEAVKTAYDLKIRGRRIPTRDAEVTLRIDTEQKPRADSRIVLTDERDAVGLRKTAVDWKISRDDIESAFQFFHVIQRYMQDLGLTQLEWNPRAPQGVEAWANRGHDVFHAMGGTRMGDDPRTSVVDRDLRVHGVDNLRVAACSVYPTGGSSNPTFTLMALSLRLAEQLAATE